MWLFSVACKSRAGGPYNLNSQAIVFVVRAGKSMIGHIDQIISAAGMIRTYYAKDNATNIQQWILVTISNGGWSKQPEFVHILEF